MSKPLYLQTCFLVSKDIHVSHMMKRYTTVGHHSFCQKVHWGTCMAVLLIILPISTFTNYKFTKY